MSVFDKPIAHRPRRNYERELILTRSMVDSLDALLEIVAKAAADEIAGLMQKIKDIETGLKGDTANPMGPVAGYKAPDLLMVARVGKLHIYKQAQDLERDVDWQPHLERQGGAE